MAYENLCMYCFEDNGGKAVCPHCGRDARAAVPAIQLLPGTLLHNDRFLVGRARGQDANGIVYTALDTRKNVPLRIREYLPRESARRLGDGSVVPAAGAEDTFEQGMQKLRASVESVEDPRKRHFFFEENGTGYIAERKSAAAAAASGADEEGGEGRNIRQIAIIVGIAVVVILGVALAIISMLNRAVDTPITPVTTLSPDVSWMPAASPSPTPYVGTTIGAIRDPELSWMDYVYPGNVEEEYSRLNTPKATQKPTSVPVAEITAQPTGGTISSKASRERILELQQVLVNTGWLSSNNVTGAYDDATRSAVRDFQQYMNDTYAIDPKLTVDGIAGQKTLYWLNQYSISTRPTPTPTAPPRVTAAPEESGLRIDENSNANNIRQVQRQLMVLDLLPAGADDGSYGSSTRQAVKRFQEVVNAIQGRKVLEESGTVDAATMAYLEYYAEWWPQNRPTPTPAVTPTAQPTQAPTGSATEVPEESNIAVGPDSNPESIRYMQGMLAQLGLLQQSGVDGVFGRGTTEAIRTFQSRVNQLQGSQVLQVTGNADATTLSYLEYYAEQAQARQTAAPTALPTAEPTAEPGEPEQPEGQISVGPDSNPESVRQVQTMLATLNLLDEASVDGVFGRGTTQALYTFQSRVNQLQGANVLEVNGLCDATTLSYLEYYYEEMLARQTTAPTQAPEPTETPANAPVVEAGSDIEDVRYVQSMLEVLGLMGHDDVDGVFGAGTTEAIRTFQSRVNQLQGENVLEPNGIMDQNTLNYLEFYYEDIISGGQEAAPTAAPEVTPEPEPEETPVPGTPLRESQDRLVALGFMTADSATGADNDSTRAAVAAFQRFVNTLYGENELAENGELDDDTLSYLENGASLGAQSAVTPSSGSDSVRRLQQRLIDTGWLTGEADGAYGRGTATAVRDFQAYVNQRYGRTVLNETGLGDIFTMNFLFSDSDAVNNPNQALTAPTEEPVQVADNPPEERQETPPEAPTPEPAAVVGNVSEPGISLSNVIASDGDVRFVNGAFTLSWGAEGDVDRYYVYVADDNNTEYISEETNRTSIDVPASNLTPGRVYTVRVGVMPTNGSSADAKWSSVRFSLAAQTADDNPPAPTETDEPLPTSISNASPAEDIEKLQLALYQGGYQTSGTRGTFDYDTRRAIADFQIYMNETYADDPNYPGLVVIDPSDENAVVDALTIEMILRGYTGM